MADDNNVTVGDNAWFEGHTGQHGGIFYAQGPSRLVLGPNLTAINNAVTGIGGFCYLGGVGTFPSLDITGPALIAGNKAQFAGAFMISGAALSIGGTNISLVGNSAQGQNGGAIYILYGTFFLDATNTLFKDNLAYGNGGAVYYKGTGAYRLGR